MAGEEFPTPELAQWAEVWGQTRGLTYDLLQALPYPVMNFSPDPNFGTLIRQIRHTADIQACYIAAIEGGKMDFTLTPRQRALERSKEDLVAYMRHVDALLFKILRGLTAEHLERSIEWRDGRVTLLQHLMWLLEHEALHQGMWTFYAKIADLPLPESWKRTWTLT